MKSMIAAVTAMALLSGCSALSQETHQKTYEREFIQKCMDTTGGSKIFCSASYVAYFDYALSNKGIIMDMAFMKRDDAMALAIRTGTKIAKEEMK